MNDINDNIRNKMFDILMDLLKVNFSFKKISQYDIENV